MVNADDIRPDEEEPVIDDSEYEYVLAFDPGGTTGVCLLRYTQMTPPELMYLHQISHGHEGFWQFFRGTVQKDFIHPVSEKWVEHNVKGANREPLIIEGVEYTIWDETITWQEPAQKALIPDEVLKKNNLWTPDKRHQMDALIHALVYLRNSGHMPTIMALEDKLGKPLAQPGEAGEKELQQEEDFEDVFKNAQEASGEGDSDSDDSDEGEGEGGGANPADAELGEDERGGGPGSGGMEWHGDASGTPEVKGTRNKLTRNGVFIGYEAEGNAEVELFDGKL